MENTLLVGLSRQVALRRELDVIANNLANLNTTGFKGENVLFEEFLDRRARTDHFIAPLDRQVSFVLDRETRTDLSQGPFQQTGSNLDVAVDGDGFFVVETPQGERYTRAGSFVLNAAGELVTPAGFRVLGNAGPVVFDPNDTDFAIAADGTISTREGERGRLRLVRFEDPSQLIKEGNNLFTSEAAPLPADARTRVVQGSLEKSNVNPVLEIGRMIEVTRAYTTLANLMGRTDELRQSAIQQLADVPA
ncbi:MAG: flagellar basal-body rod protein FlgF [Bradyrhizobiaceae bacterium]|nr:flagellar basal-body rod protein FlgF [Bradyrhizobiaceae bacterium]